MHEVQLPPIRPRSYEAPATLADVLVLLADHGAEARVVAGGTDLMVELDRRVGGEVTVLVDITRVPGLDAIEVQEGRVHLGPLVTHNQCATDPALAAHGLALAQACVEVGSPALRNRATVVGNVVTASPANDTISALAALGAELTLTSVRGTRTVPIGDFHTGVRATVLEPDELVTALSFPARGPESRSVFVKLGLRRAQAISVVHVAMRIDRTDDGTVRDAAIALGSVAPTIVRSAEAESALIGSLLDDRAISAAGAAAAADVQPIDDLRAPADYRTELIPAMVRRGLMALRDDAATVPESPVTLGGPSIAPDAHAYGAEPGSAITATVNGLATSAPWTPGTLLDWLRTAGSPGTKEGCAEGECGACTVHLDGTAVLSCLIPAGRADGAAITTIEGLADTSLHPVQQRFVDEAAVQCGYCIPGFLMAGAALEAECPTPDREQLRLGLSGNLCRCTGYYAIEAAFGVRQAP